MFKKFCSDKRINHLLISFVLSFCVVGVLVANAFVDSNVGYPSFFQPISFALMLVGLVLVIPPAMVFSVLAKIGLVGELRGRESFIESNPALWIFCVVFYTIVVYIILRTKYNKGK